MLSTETDLMNFEMDFKSMNPLAEITTKQEFYCRIIPFELSNSPNNLELH
jgi:hypothetical protein